MGHNMQDATYIYSFSDKLEKRNTSMVKKFFKNYGEKMVVSQYSQSHVTISLFYKTCHNSIQYAITFFKIKLEEQ